MANINCIKNQCNRVYVNAGLDFQHVLGKYFDHHILFTWFKKEILRYCFHKLYIYVNVQKVQCCLPLSSKIPYQVFLQYWIIQRKVCKTSRLQILPWVKFPWSTMIVLITYWGFRKHRVQKWLMLFRLYMPYKGFKGLCCSQQVSAGLVWDALTVKSGFPAEMLCAFLLLL